MTKRVLSMVLALIMMLGCLAGIAVSAEETAYTAKLGFANSDWSAQEWGDNVNTTVTGAGTYTLSWDGAASNALVFVVDIGGAGAAFAAANLQLTALTVAVDGVEIPVDLTKIVTGDLENNGNFRIEIYNEYGSTKADPGIDPAAVSFATNLTVTFTLADPNATAAYDAKLGFANSDWSAQEWGDNAKTVVNGAGDYTLSWDGAASDALVFVIDIAGAAEEFAAKNLGLTALSVLVDGVEVPVDLTKVVTGDLENNTNFRIEIYNEYGSTKENAPIDPKAVSFATNLTVNFTIGVQEAPVEPAGPVFDLFIAYGGDRAESNDWGYEYYGADTEKSAGITSVKETIAVGETKTISLTFENAAVYSWFFAPCLVADDISWIGDVDFDITCKVNGEEVAINMEADSQGRTWWTEGTGDYSGTQCIRLAGGYNEWGAQFIAQPTGLTTIEYTVTLNAVAEKVEPGTPYESDEEYRLLLGFQGGTTAEGWDLAYFGNAVEGITAVEATVKSGDTATISLTFAEPVGTSWYFMPLLVGPGAGEKMYAIDFDMVLKVDGQEVAINWDADAEGKTWWQEGTDSFIAEDCIRMGGGYNEWATQYVGKLSGFTTIEYTITFNSIQIVDAVEEAGPVEIDKMGIYNAYLMLQTPNWTFRNAHDDAFYGIEGSSWADLGLAWGQYLVHQDHPGETWGQITDAVIAGNGTYTLSITDFGTVFADDFTAAGQDYFNIIAISTDLPAGADVAITDVQLIIDGKVRHTYAEAYINEESGGSLQILIQNIWNADVKEISYYPAPTESLEIKFTISGFDYDQEIETPDPGDDPQPTDPQPTDPQPTDPQPTDPQPTEPQATQPQETQPQESKPLATQPAEPAGDNNTGIVIAIVAAVAVIAVVVVLVLKKKKN